MISADLTMAATIVLVVAPPYVYLLAKCAATAYFNCKLTYHKMLVHELGAKGAEHD